MLIEPVVEWAQYDTVYTERYMNLPSVNPDGYKHAAVRNVTAFGEVDLALAHGSADDNVHPIHMATLLDRLTQSGVGGYQYRQYTDSSVSHSSGVIFS